MSKNEGVKERFVASVLIGTKPYTLSEGFDSTEDAEKSCLKNIGKEKGSYSISRIVRTDEGKIGYQHVKSGRNF